MAGGRFKRTGGARRKEVGGEGGGGGRRGAGDCFTERVREKKGRGRGRGLGILGLHKPHFSWHLRGCVSCRRAGEVDVRALASQLPPALCCASFHVYVACLKTLSSNVGANLVVLTRDVHFQTPS